MWTSTLEKRLAGLVGQPIEVMQVGFTQWGQDKILLFGFDSKCSAPVLVCRLTRSARGRRSLYREAAARTHAWRRVPPRIRAALPRLEIMRVPGGICLVETYVPGQAPRISTSAEGIERMARESLAWLAELQSATEPPAGRGPAVSLLTDSWIGQVERRFRDPRVRHLLHRLRPYLGLLDQARPCTVHGDFWPGNFKTKGHEFSVIDWEFSRRYGSPWFDPVVNLMSLAFELPGDKAESFDRCFLSGSELSRLFGALLDSFRWGSRARDAWSLAIVLAAAEIVSQWPGDFETSPKYSSLQALVRRDDPVRVIRQALWAN